MPEPKDIVTTNFESYNKKLAFQDSILIVSLLFILVNYFLIIEPNYSINQQWQFSSKKIQSYNNKISGYKDDIINKMPESKQDVLELKEADFKNEDLVFKKLNLTANTTALKDSVKKKIGSIQSAIVDKKIVAKKNDDLKKKIAESKDAMSLVKILVFVNDGSEHFALFLSFIVIIVVIYFYLTRKQLLNLLSRTLRIEKDKNQAFNKYYEYPVSCSIWLTPIPSEISYSVSSDELQKILAVKNSHNTYKKVMTGCFILLISLQFRLYFIELNISELTFNLWSVLSLTLAIATGLICYFWITQKSIPDHYNSDEEKRRTLSRREFIGITTSATSVVAIALSIPILKHLGDAAKSSKIYNRLFNKPRYVSKAKRQNPQKKQSKEFEQTCLDLMTSQKYDDCINLLMPELIGKLNSKSYVKQQQAIRLSSLLARVLLFVINRKGREDCEATFTAMINLLKVSDNETLKAQAKTLSDANYKWIKIYQDEKNIIKWNKCIFT